MAVKKQKENLILQAVCEYLAYKNYYFFRVNNTPVFDYKIKRYRKMPKWSVKGVSDIIALKNGKTFFIETKGMGYQSDDQKKFQKNVEEAGHTYILVREMKDLFTGF